ncbi:MAG: hypothetical protein KKF42_09000 [Actinobacteria bacterium]|nr:hypothetical protein [Actinomycetota bacterium]
MSSHHMSFRLNHYQLAKALRILVTLEPNQPISSLSQAAKIIIIDWISKHSINSSLETSQADIEAIKLIASLPSNQIDPYNTIQNAFAQAQSNYRQPSQLKVQTQKPDWQIQRDLEDERIFQEMKQESLEKAKQAEQEKLTQQNKDIAEQIKLASQALNRTKPKPSEFHDPNITESSISTVTDFSPPPEWKDQQDK